MRKAMRKTKVGANPRGNKDPTLALAALDMADRDNNAGRVKMMGGIIECVVGWEKESVCQKLTSGLRERGREVRCHNIGSFNLTSSGFLKSLSPSIPICLSPLQSCYRSCCSLIAVSLQLYYSPYCIALLQSCCSLSTIVLQFFCILIEVGIVQPSHNLTTTLIQHQYLHSV